MTPLETLLDTYRAAGQTDCELGTWFEERGPSFLRTEPCHKEL